MGNQNGKPADRSADVAVGRSPARTKPNDATAPAENLAQSATENAVEAPKELTTDTEEPIDKYQVTETTKEVTLEVSTMATEVGSSTPLHAAEGGKEKSAFVDIAELNDATKDESAETATHDEKPSDVSAAEKDLLLGKGPVSGELSESGISTEPTKVIRRSPSSSLLKSCLFCIPHASS